MSADRLHAMATVRNVARGYRERPDPAQRTPPSLFALLDDEFGFTLDAAASDLNHLCHRYFTEADDALKQPWTGVVWCNPPYGRGLELWMRKALDSARAGATVVCLVPVASDLDWWHEIVLPFAREVRFLRGRLHFGREDDGRPARGAFGPHAVVVFG